MVEVKKFTIRRILVPLASPGQSLAALEMAARLAAGFEAELVGIYLREPDFLMAAALPASRFSHVSRAERQILDVTHMERALRVRAGQLRAALEATARRMNLRWSFQDITGDIEEMIEQAVRDFDLVTLGHPGPGLEVTGKAARRAVSSFFTMRPGLQDNAPVVALLNGGLSALEPAARLARLFGRELKILMTPQSGKGDDKRVEDVRDWLGAHRQAAGIVMPQQADQTGILAALEELGPGLLVMGRANALRAEQDFGDLMSRLDCPLFLVAG